MHLIKTVMAGALALSGAEADWEQTGRPLPPRDAGTIPLDPRLTDYVRCRSGIAGQADGSAATILPDLFARWSGKFAALHPAAAIHAPPPFGAPQGKLSIRLREFLDGKRDFALVSRTLTDADLDLYRAAHGADPLVIPVAAGSWRHFGFVDTVVVIVNRANPIRRLSLAQIDAIFSAERRRGHRAARSWDDLGVAEWRGQPIHPVGAAGWLGEDSARSAVVRQRALLGGRWSPGLEGTGNEASAPDQVAQDRHAIAITGLGHLPPGTRAVAISATAGGAAVAPDYREVIRGRYPFSRTVDMIVPRQPGGTVAPAVEEFLRFILSRDGQAVVAEQGVFLPLRAGQVERSLALLGPCLPRTSPAR